MFLKNKNIIFKIRRSKVTDYAALSKLGIGLTYIFVTSKHQRQTRECSGSVVESLT